MSGTWIFPRAHFPPPPTKPIVVSFNEREMRGGYQPRKAQFFCAATYGRRKICRHFLLTYELTWQKRTTKGITNDRSAKKGKPQWPKTSAQTVSLSVSAICAILDPNKANRNTENWIVFAETHYFGISVKDLFRSFTAEDERSLFIPFQTPIVRIGGWVSRAGLRRIVYEVIRRVICSE